ncbi:type II toxin-antitoxin system VapC family toxin [Thermococcus sp. Bubb.Bath]|uniref:type II toxin-antitoxin system VapC family toxin n=1 Tax=Thermococcus sp. Bubb.Bath TaxID=1638242 RepID=UPI00143ADB0D|nr:type II toxin-antitoxin system VapC family toxin [Thermococcus sp. Bubb.Bath]NJF25762.1 PIN domain-containing protein [Thermococcus sp. Bubb.Bath]
MNFVVDASLLIDAFSKYNMERRKLALSTLKKIEEYEIYAPRLAQVEFASVLSRFTPERAVEEFLGVFDFITLVGEGEISQDAIQIALKTHSRAADAYYITTAKRFNAVLLTNDRRMAENAKLSGVTAIYVLEENKKLHDLTHKKEEERN